MNSSSSVSSIDSIFDNFETDEAIESFSNDSGADTGDKWVLKDLLNKDDNDGRDCPDEEGAPANEAC